MKVLPVLLLLLFPSVLIAEDSTAKACSGDEYRQFDFWIGDWEVFDTNTGDKVGDNRIEGILAGCGLQENWIGAGKSRGHSLNIYDRQSGRWHQSWIDNSGLLLSLDGGLDKDGRMVLEGKGLDAEGKPVINRISWTPQAGSVRQQWQVSKDGGKNWQVVFDGTYKPRRQ